jgi:hypothetical protein
VLGHLQSDRYRTLFATLARIYPVDFRVISSLGDEALDALLVLDGRISEGEAAAAKGIPAYVVVPPGAARNAAAGPELRFGMSDCLDICLRGQTMTETETGSLPALSVKPGDEVLADMGGHPVWINRQVGPCGCQITAAQPPLLAQNELLFQHLSEGRFLRLLPLINFLRQTVRDIGWQDAPLQTCFIFDDPSLYWPSYGFLDYRQLAELAARHGLFISVATIPLDTWWVNSTVAATFRSNPRLSVIMHGNNHTTHELLVKKGSDGHLENAAQAMRRIERLEQRHGLAGFKIMEAPHGAISHEMMGHLMSLGYEAVLGTTGLLVHHNPDVAWPATLGIDRADVLDGGLPVISRIRLSAYWKNEVILSALLRKPFVIAGHHWDAADDFKLLEEIAKTINGLPCFTWGSPLDIARNNYKHMRHGNELSLKLYGRRVSLCVPEGVKYLCVHRPWLQTGHEAENLIITRSGAEIFRGCGNAVVGPIPVDAGEVLDISSHPKCQIDFRTVKTPRTEGWPVVRKILMEMRDRSSPARYQAMRWIHGARAKPPGKKGDY